MFELTVEDSFDSAHSLREYQGACERVHGHTYRVQIAIRAAETDSHGLVRDFREVKEMLSRIVERLDHRNINEVPPFDQQNPTAENLARYFHTEMKQSLGDAVHRATVWESPGSSSAYWEEEP